MDTKLQSCFCIYKGSLQLTLFPLWTSASILPGYSTASPLILSCHESLRVSTELNTVSRHCFPFPLMLLSSMDPINKVVEQLEYRSACWSFWLHYYSCTAAQNYFSKFLAAVSIVNIVFQLTFVNSIFDVNNSYNFLFTQSDICKQTRLSLIIQLVVNILYTVK